VSDTDAKYVLPPGRDLANFGKELALGVGAGGYLLANSTWAGCEVIPPEICDAIKNAATTAGRLISLKNWSTESISSVPQGNIKGPTQTLTARGRSIHPLRGQVIACQKLIG
jgi:hypothetical protein